MDAVFGIHMITDPSVLTFAAPTMRVHIFNILYLTRLSEFILGLRGDVHWFRRVVRFDHDPLFIQDIL
jgi:hypothetical protein